MPVSVKRIVRARGAAPLLCALCLCALAAAGCKQIAEKLSVAPRELRDVPAARLAFRLEPDIAPELLPAPLRDDAAEEPLAAVKLHFETSRKEEALLRTVLSPDGQRALALYAPNDPVFPADEFRVDLYSADGRFLRNVLPEDLSGVFMSSVAWSPDGQWIAFTGRRTARPTPTPPPVPAGEPAATAAPVPEVTDPNAPATPAPTAAPIIAPVQTFSTEQIYLCDRDGTNLRPLTARDGLIYFHVAWSPGGESVAALACKQDELERRITENKQIAGRPRVVGRDGRERLLSDELMDALPVWSPDGAKVATASETDVFVYDAEGDSPTGARLPLREALIPASAKYDAEVLKQKSGGSEPISLNPVVRLAWVLPETLLAQTGYVRIFESESEPTRRYVRWHVVHLSPQAVALK